MQLTTWIFNVHHLFDLVFIMAETTAYCFSVLFKGTQNLLELLKNLM